MSAQEPVRVRLALDKEILGAMPDRDLVVYEIVYPHILNALQSVETVDDALKAMDDEANATFQ